jgi:transposase
MAKKGRRAINEERLAAIQMYDNGLTADRIAEILDVGRSSVFDWISKYRKGGLRYPRNSLPVARPCWTTAR